MSGRRAVLHVMRTTGLSGAEGHLVQLVADLGDRGWRAGVLVPTPQPDGAGVAAFRRALEDAGAAVQVLPMPHDGSLRLLRRLGAAATSGAWDVLHTHLVHADWHGGVVAALLGGRAPALVTSKHNHDPFRANPAFRPIEGALLRRADSAIAISGSLAEFTERWGWRRPEAVLYGLPAGPDPGPVPRSGDGPRRLLAVGRLEPQKGLDVLLDAVAAARGRVDLRLQIAGEGSLRGALEEQVAQLGLGDVVELLGQRSDVAELMAASDVFVHCARWEGFGLVLLEAMRAGLPVIATRVGAIPEVVADGVSGVLVAADDPSSFAAAIVEVAGDDARLTALGAAGRARLIDVFSPATTAERTIAVYEQALRRQAAR